MDIRRYGVILNVEKYDECVAFYRDLFQLNIMFSKTEGDFKLTCLEYGSGYLMIETQGFADIQGKQIKYCPSKFRFNVLNIEETLKRVKCFDVSAEIVKNEWGSTINIFDPDGNRVGIRDEVSFKAQINA